MMRILLPAHLRALTGVERYVDLPWEGAATLQMVLERLETIYPMLRGTIRNQITQERRPFIRFFVCGEDWSHDAMERILPESVCRGSEVLRIVGAMAGG